MCSSHTQTVGECAGEQSVIISPTMTTRPPALGIDLGTTYTCAAVHRDGQVTIIEDEQGHKTMPSYVAFQGDHRVVGYVAKKNALQHLENTVYDAKRLIGRRFDDHFVQRDLKTWPFKVIDDNHRPKVEVNFERRAQTFRPEQISAMVLEKVKAQAENFLSQPVSRAVITVPAYFNQLQRQATLDAARIAGFEEYRLLSEPTAAALAYGLKADCDQRPKKVLIYDLGGGTFDISVLVYDGETVDVHASAGDTHLGGQDFDDLMVAYFVLEIKRKMGTDISKNKRAIQRLRLACESLKRDLSAAEHGDLVIDGLVEGEDFDSSLSRARFEDLCQELFAKTIDHVRDALRQAHLTKADIDEVVLVGGSTRIPAVQRLLADFFEDPAKIVKSINVDEAVARGAALHAAQIHNPEVAVQVRRVRDATNLSLGIETIDGGMSVLVPKNTFIPTKKVKHFSTARENQTSAVFAIYQGERALAKDNAKLGEFTFERSRARSRTTPNFVITFEINESCILKVSGYEKATGQRRAIEINTLRREAEVGAMIETAERHRQADEVERKRLEARRTLERRALEIKNSPKSNLATNKANEILCWIEGHATASASEFHQQLANLETFLRKL